MAIKTVRVQLNGSWHTLTYNSVTGKYEKSITAPSLTSFNLTGGFYPVTVEAEDDAGNKSTDESSRLFVRETIAPVVTITRPTTGSLIDTNTPEIVFELTDEADGSGIDITTLKLKIDNGEEITYTDSDLNSVASGNGYKCTYQSETPLSDGAHTISISVLDNDGNQSKTAESVITIDTLPPTLTVTAPEDGLKTNKDTILVTGTTGDPGNGSVVISIAVNNVDQGIVDIDDSGAFSKEVQIKEGHNEIVVTAKDRIGRETKVTRIVVVKTNAPVIGAITATPNPVNANESVLISVTVTDE